MAALRANGYRPAARVRLEALVLLGIQAAGRSLETATAT
jgi:hypothetical protein